MVYLIYTTYISIDLVHHKVFHAKFGKGGIWIINISEQWTIRYIQ